MPNDDDASLWESLVALSTLVSLAVLACAVLLFVCGPTWPRDAAAWLEIHTGGLRAELASFHKGSEARLAALMQIRRAPRAQQQRNEIHPLPRLDPMMSLSWVSRHYPEAVWPKPPVPSEWSSPEIKKGLRECLQTLAPMNVDIEPLPPIRRDACGMSAPVLLRGFGRKHKIAVQPPATMNCQMVAALVRWLDQVQPLARAAFGSPVVKLVGSSYACRNIYNRKIDRLSQHAFGNAFDLPTFVLASGRRIHVVLGWGPTARDEAARPVPGVTKSSSSDATRRASHRKSDQLKISVAAKTGDDLSDGKTPEIKSSGKTIDVTEAKFLRRVHKEACTVFTTVLGPEANDAHRDHLHLDLQDRPTHTVCK